MHLNDLRPVLATLALSAVLFVAPASAEMIGYKADLKGANEVPPVNQPGTGTLDSTYDTVSKKLTWTITYTGLSGPATGAHFHGPAAAGANAGVVVPFSAPLTSPIKGEATLTDAQAADLQAGRWYANIHTAVNAGGEIRGQAVKK
ncbi:MAG: CHRD domain-containing protein [Rhodospirillaceae bacterium]|nr:CHRD domain-containing protein [Rhodospirillaceae bacterium]